MEITLRLDGPADEAALYSLRDWLADDEELRRIADVGFGPEGSPEGGLSGALLPEFIRLLAQAKDYLDAADLVALLWRWSKTRDGREGVVVANGRGDSVVIKSDDAETIARVAEILAAAERFDEPSGDGDEGA